MAGFVSTVARCEPVNPAGAVHQRGRIRSSLTAKPLRPSPQSPGRSRSRRLRSSDRSNRDKLAAVRPLVAPAHPLARAVARGPPSPGARNKKRGRECVLRSHRPPREVPAWMLSRTVSPSVVFRLETRTFCIFGSPWSTPCARVQRGKSATARCAITWNRHDTLHYAFSPSP